MKHLDKDNLEDFFRESLDGYGDYPSDGLWDKIDGNIPPKPTFWSKVQPWHWLAATGTIFLGVLIYHFVTVRDLSTQLQLKDAAIAQIQEELRIAQTATSQQEAIASSAVVYQEQLKGELATITATSKQLKRQNTQLANTLEETEQQITTLSAANQLMEREIMAIVTNSNDGSNVMNSSTKPVENISSSSSNKIITSTNNNPSLTTTTTVSNTSDVLNGWKETNILNDDATRSSLFEETTTIVANQFLNTTAIRITDLGKNTNTSSKLEEIESLPTKQLSSTIASLSALDTKSLEKLPHYSNTLKPSKWWSWSMKAGLHSTHRRIDAPADSELMKLLNQQERALVARDLGFGLNYHIGNRWIFSTGMQEQLMEQEIRHQMEIIYDEGGSAFDVTGKELMNYDYEVPTSFGDVEISLLVSNVRLNDGNDFEAGDTISTFIQGTQKQQSFSFPLLAQLNIFKQGNFSLGIKGGLIANYYANGFAEFKTHNFILRDRLQLERTNEVRAFSGLKKFNINWTLGAIGMYDVTSEWSVFVEPTFSASFSKVYAKDDIRTYPFRTGVNVGVFYHLFDDKSANTFRRN